MAGANSNIQITDLDFASVKQNFITFLKSQDTFKDYNFSGSALSTLLDVLTYNTQYNAYYMNMVANEMFLDTALQRGSVVSHAKLLGYIPQSAVAPTAYVNINVLGANTSALTLPKYSQFLSQPIDGTVYTFVNTDTKTISVANNVGTFADVTLKQGVPVTLTFSYDSGVNTTSAFELPDQNIDTSTLLVQVYTNSYSTEFEVYTNATNFLELDSESTIYFLQEELSGKYQISFGDGVLGKKLNDGSRIVVSYISTNGTAATGANTFAMMSSIGNYIVTVDPVVAASSGKERESISSIKYQAPKSFSAQNRAVTKEDYITLINQNSLGITFDAVNVWGGQENPTPVYGQVYICLKPTGAYTLTATQKQKLIKDVIKPISVMTVEPTIVDPDYTYIKIAANVMYDPSRTNYTASQIQLMVKNAIQNFSNSTLNTFNSTFSATDLNTAIKNVDNSIITNEISIQLQKKFYPNLVTPTTYKLYYGVPLNKGMFLSGVNSSPAVQFRNPSNLANIIDGVYIEEVPSSTGGVESISIINAGYGYQYAPTVTILGDGTGATAEAVITATGVLKSINVLTAGNNYTSAIATITPVSNDTTGQLGAAVVNLQGRYGTLRTYYNNTLNVKTVLNNNAGTVDYNEGVVTLNAFGPIQVDNDLGQLSISTNPSTTIVSSSFNRIITVDPFDPNAIVVTVITKT